MDEKKIKKCKNSLIEIGESDLEENGSDNHVLFNNMKKFNKYTKPKVLKDNYDFIEIFY